MGELPPPGAETSTAVLFRMGDCNLLTGHDLARIRFLVSPARGNDDPSNPSVAYAGVTIDANTGEWVFGLPVQASSTSFGELAGTLATPDFSFAFSAVGEPVLIRVVHDDYEGQIVAPGLNPGEIATDLELPVSQERVFSASFESGLSFRQARKAVAPNGA